MDQELIVGSGAEKDPRDERDQTVRDLVAAGAIAPVTEADWDKGYNAYDEAGIKPEKRDQGGRLTCVGETCAMYGRVLRKVTAGVDEILSASSIYPFIRLPNGGAYLRDGAKQTVAGRLVPKSALPDEDANGIPVPEMMAADLNRITPEISALGKKLDVFDNYRMVDGSTDDIGIFAAAIRAGKGLILGFTGTNPGWTCPACRAPKPGESKWGHAVFGAAFGKTDVEECGLPVGTKAVFTPNSWGGRYTFTKGRWAGYQAIPEPYFQAGEQTAVGFVKGIHVFPSWTIVPSEIVPPSQFQKDFTTQHDKKLGRCPEDGSRYLVLGPSPEFLIGRVLHIAESRAGLAALACIDYGIDKTRRVDIPKAVLAKITVTEF